MFLNKTYEQMKESIKGVGGWLGSIPQREFMFNLAKCSKVGAEIGTYHGLSAVIVGLGMRDNKGCKYYCIDTYKMSSIEYKERRNTDTLNIFLKHRTNLGLEDTLIPIIGNSQDRKIIDSVPDNLDFLYIDGSHETKDVYLDIKNWVPKVKLDGLILFHDHTWPTIKKAIEQGVKEGLIRFHTSWDDFGVYKKVRKVR